MKCPLKFRLLQFEGGDECDPECAWLVKTIDGKGELVLVCAVTLVGKNELRKQVNAMGLE